MRQNRGGHYTTLEVPGSSDTWATGINNAGQIVGSFSTERFGVSHGFLWRDGHYTTLEVPGSAATWATGINTAGQIVGTFAVSQYDPYDYLNGSGLYHGFVWSGGHFTTLDPPGSSYTSATGINNAGQIVGTFYDGSGAHGFLATPVSEPLPGDLDHDGDVDDADLALLLQTEATSCLAQLLLHQTCTIAVKP